MNAVLRSLQLLAGCALFALGLDTFSVEAWRLAVLGGLLCVYGAVLYVGGLKGVRAHIGDRAAQGISAVAGLLVVGVVGSMVFERIGPEPDAAERLRAARRASARGDDGQGGGDNRRATTGDPELGWAPANEPGHVGLRAQRVDSSREHIVFLGDSVLHGTGVGDEETAAHYLGMLLPRYQVLNVSVPGYSIDQYYLHLRRVLPLLRPKLVVVGIYAGNDYQVTGMENGWDVPKPLYRIRDGKLHLDTSRDLRRGCVRAVSQSLLSRPWRRDKIALRTITEGFCAPLRLGRAELEAVISQLFAAIEELARSGGAQVLFALLPNRNQGQQIVQDDDYRYMSRYANLRRLIEQGGHRLYELYPDLLQAGDEESLFVAPGHYSPRGHRRFAEALRAHLERTGLLPSR